MRLGPADPLFHLVHVHDSLPSVCSNQFHETVSL
jgi:hypothetical protein